MRRFRTRILLFFLGLASAILVAEFFAVNQASFASAHAQIEHDLKITERIFNRLIATRYQRLVDAARILSSDFAFKRAVSTYDHGTILSALDNLTARIDADAMALISPDRQVMADTLHRDRSGADFPLVRLIERAEQEGSASSVAFIDGDAYQIVVTPLLAPDLIAWLCISFSIDRDLVEELKRITLSELTLMNAVGSRWASLASTLPPSGASALAGVINHGEWRPGEPSSFTLGDTRYVAIMTDIRGEQDSRIIAIMQRSLDEALEPYFALRSLLVILSLVGLALAVVGAFVVSQSVSDPVTKLANAVAAITRGDYDQRVEIDRIDEIGQLSAAVNTMAEGLAERDRTRDLLGKVVSPDVAHELMRKEVTLGGEERVMTAFFSDVAGFTSVSEALEPHALVSLLNEYLSAMTEAIFARGGTVDKYVGDAIVAFWGAPVENPDHALQATLSALDQQRILKELRKKWGDEGRHQLHVRMGLNTGPMVVGNMGSKARMDYTIMGDAVNLASRLEGVNKYYGTSVIVSETTATIVGAQILLRRLDRVRVQGKNEPIGIFEAVATRNDATSQERGFVELFEEGLSAFSALDLDRAARLFSSCHEYRSEDPSCLLYLKRIKELVQAPPKDDWQPVYFLPK